MRYRMLSFYTLSPSIVTLVSALAFHPVSGMTSAEEGDDKKFKGPLKTSRAVSPIAEEEEKDEDDEGFLIIPKTQEEYPPSPNLHPSDMAEVSTLNDVRRALLYCPQLTELKSSPPIRAAFQREYIEPLVIKLMTLTGWKVSEAGLFSNPYFYADTDSVSDRLKEERRRLTLEDRDSLKSKIFIAQLEALEQSLRNREASSSSKETLPPLLPDKMERFSGWSTYLTHPTQLLLFVSPNEIDTVIEILDLLYNTFEKLQDVYSQIQSGSVKAMNSLLNTRILLSGSKESTLKAWGKMVLESNKTYYEQKARELDVSLDEGTTPLLPKAPNAREKVITSPPEPDTNEFDEEYYDWKAIQKHIEEENPSNDQNDAERSLTSSPVVLHQDLENPNGETLPLPAEDSYLEAGFQHVQNDAERGLTSSPVVFQPVQPESEANEGFPAFPLSLDFVTKTIPSLTVTETADEDGFYHVNREAVPSLLEAGNKDSAAPITPSDHHLDNMETTSFLTTAGPAEEDRSHVIGEENAPNPETGHPLPTNEDLAASAAASPKDLANPAMETLLVMENTADKAGSNPTTSVDDTSRLLPLIPEDTSAVPTSETTKVDARVPEDAALRSELEATRRELAHLREEASQLKQQGLFAETQLRTQEVDQTRQAIEALFTGVTNPIEKMIQNFEQNFFVPALNALKELSQDPKYEEYQFTFEEITKTLAMLQQNGLSALKHVIATFESFFQSNNNLSPPTQLTLAEDFVHNLKKAFEEATSSLALPKEPLFQTNYPNLPSNVSQVTKSLPFALEPQASTLSSPPPSSYLNKALFNSLVVGSSSARSGLNSTGFSRGSIPAVSTQIQDLARAANTLTPAMQVWKTQMDKRLQMVRSTTQAMKAARGPVKITRRRIGDGRTGSLLGLA